METIVIAILVGTVMWVIGLFCGMASPSHSGSCLTGHDLCHHWDYEAKSVKIASLERTIFILEQENQKYRCYPQYHMGYDFGHKLDAMNYATLAFREKDKKDQKIADLMRDTVLSVKNLAQKLDIDISKK